MLRDNRVISPIRKSSEGLWVGCGTAHSRFFVLPHFINQQPEARRNQFSRLAAHSFVPMWQSERRKESVHNLFAITWHYKPSLCILFVTFLVIFFSFTAIRCWKYVRLGCQTWPLLTHRQAIFCACWKRCSQLNQPDRGQKEIKPK